MGASMIVMHTFNLIFFCLEKLNLHQIFLAELLEDCKFVSSNCNVYSNYMQFCLLKVCTICKQIHGVCIKCEDCTTIYHVTCAARAGYHMEVNCCALVG